MKNLIAYLSLSGLCIASTTASAADGAVVPANKSTIDILYSPKTNHDIPPLKPGNVPDIRAAFLLATDQQTDPLKSMTLRSAAAGAGIMGAIMGGRIAAKFWINPHLIFAPGVDIGSKTADFRLTF